jgi:quercetin dioxygenase-like cupin family protein
LRLRSSLIACTNFFEIFLDNFALRVHTARRSAELRQLRLIAVGKPQRARFQLRLTNYDRLSVASNAGRRGRIPREAKVKTTKTKLLIGATAIVITAVGIALATPIVKLASPLLSVGHHSADIFEGGTAVGENGQPFNAALETEGPATFSTQVAAFAVGGQNGWHSHPGLVAVTLTSGTITWYDENCNPTVYKAGDSWVEGSQIHAFRNTGTNNVQLVAWFITAKGEPLRTDQAAPACAAGLGL